MEVELEMNTLQTVALFQKLGKLDLLKETIQKVEEDPTPPAKKIKTCEGEPSGLKLKFDKVKKMKTCEGEPSGLKLKFDKVKKFKKAIKVVKA